MKPFWHDLSVDYCRMATGEITMETLGFPPTTVTALPILDGRRNRRLVNDEVNLESQLVGASPEKSSVIRWWQHELRQVQELRPVRNKSLRLPTDAYVNLSRPMPDELEDRIRTAESFYLAFRRMECWRLFYMGVQPHWPDIHDVLAIWVTHRLDELWDVYQASREQVKWPMTGSISAKAVTRVAAAFLEYSPEPNLLEPMARRIGRAAKEWAGEFGPTWFSEVGARVDTWRQATGTRLEPEEDPGIRVYDPLTAHDQKWKLPNESQDTWGLSDQPDVSEPPDKQTWDCPASHPWGQTCNRCFPQFP